MDSILPDYRVYASNVAWNASARPFDGIKAPVVLVTPPHAPKSRVFEPKATSDAYPATIHEQHRQSDEGPKLCVDSEHLEAQHVSPVYDTLDEGFIRLVQIEQTSLANGIECRTKHFPLTELPPYIALSYACGPRPANFGIGLNGKNWYIRENLSHYLRQRMQMKPTSREWLWIDAICINQSNLSERAHQVKLMADIYSKASRVLVWLGPAYEDSDAAMVALLDVHTFGWLQEYLPRLLGLPTWYILNGPEFAQIRYQMPLILAMRSLCSREYWHRLWCLQELKLSGDKDIMCGSKVVAWAQFKNWFASEQHLRVPGVTQNAAGHMVKLVSIHTSTPLSTLLRMTVGLRCEEAKDKAYALLGLAPDAWHIEPDYASDIPVFLNTILEYYIQQHPKASLSTIVCLCRSVESRFGCKRGTIFGSSHSTSHLPTSSLVYRRSCTRAVILPGMSLLWALRYQHPRAQELIKMVYRCQSPSSYVVSAMVLTGSITGFPFVFRLEHGILVFALLVSLLTTTFVLSCLVMVSMARIRVRSAGRVSSKWYPYSLRESRLTSLTLLPFAVGEISILLATFVLWPFKQWYVHVSNHWKEGASEGIVDLAD
jgi:hypothetical protein